MSELVGRTLELLAESKDGFVSSVRNIFSTRTMALTIRGGQLYDGDTPIRPEIGNPEHIAALKRANAACEEAKRGISVDLDVDIHYDISFKCVCGKHVEVSGDIYSSFLTDTYDAVAQECYANNVVATCYHCGEKYRVETDDNGCLKAFLKEKR